MVASRTTVTVDFAEIRTAVRAVDEEAQALDASVTDGPPGLVGMPSREADD
jgi:hypothetical protein